MKMSYTKFPVPVLDDNTPEMYGRLYGETGEEFCNCLNIAPNEIAVISRLIAYLEAMKGRAD